jgi:hypothetical protein
MDSQVGAHPTSHEWVGLYRNQKDVMHTWVACARYFKEFRFGPMQFNAKLMGIFLKPTVGLQYFTLTKVKPNARNAKHPMAFSGWMSRVQWTC